MLGLVRAAQLQPEMLPVDSELPHPSPEGMGLIPRSVAAPRGPSIRPPVRVRACSMCRAMAMSRDTSAAAGLAGLGDFGVGSPRGASADRWPRARSTARPSPPPKIAARSMTAANSRTLPGQE